MPEPRTLVLAGGGFVLVAAVDPWSLPAAGLLCILGFFMGASLPPFEVIVERPVTWVRERLGPVAMVRRRAPWTEPGFSSWPATR